jgi:hypothetical protein
MRGERSRTGHFYILRFYILLGVMWLYGYMVSWLVG